MTLGSRFSRLSLFERILSLATSVRPGEGRSVALLITQVYLLLLAYYLVRPLRESLILSEGSPEIRAYATGVIAITLIFVIPLYKLLFDYLDGYGDKSRIMRWVGAFFVTNLLIFAFLVWLEIPVSIPFYIWVGIFSAMVVTQFWAFAADLFNIKSGQRLFSVIMVGAALGAISGSQISGRFHSALGSSSLMLLSAGILVLVILIARHAESAVPAGSSSVQQVRSSTSRRGFSDIIGGFNVVARSRYLVLIALFVMLLNLINSTGGYILTTFLSAHAKEMVEASQGAISTEQVMSGFFGNYFTWISIIQLLLQLFLVSRIFSWFGVRGAILVLPLVMLINYGLVAMVPVFALVRILMIAETSTMLSIQNTTNHTLYLPVTREQKYVGKTTIDTFFMRFGDLIYAAMIFVLAQQLGLDVMAAIYINVGLAIVLLAIGTMIGRHHHGEIRQKLVNLPPELNSPLPNVYVPAGQVLAFSIPDQAFMDPDPGDTLVYSARAKNGGPLAEWIHFDRHNQTFSVRPPTGACGSVDIELTASDFEGLSIAAWFTIEYGPGAVPRFLTDGGVARREAPGPEADVDAGMAVPPRDFQS